MTLIIRPAIKGDAAIAAVLLAETMGEFGVEVLGLGKPELQYSAFRNWFVDSGNRFSYQCSTIAEKYGMAAGLLLAFPGSKLTALELGCAKQIFGIYGLIGAFRMIWLNSSLVNNKETEKGEYFIAHLAVDEHFRRQGIAQALLQKAEMDGRALGLFKLALEVEIDNENAIALYRKAGFEIEKTIYFNNKSIKIKSPGFYKLIKSI